MNEDRDYHNQNCRNVFLGIVALAAGVLLLLCAGTVLAVQASSAGVPVVRTVPAPTPGPCPTGGPPPCP